MALGGSTSKDVSAPERRMNDNADVVYYDVKKAVKISADSSKSGLGAVLEQDGHPAAYASRALSDTQQRYAQIEELLATVFACEKFHQFIYGKQVDVETDHKPLVNILRNR